MLQQTPNETASMQLPWLKSGYTLLLQSLGNPEQHRQIAGIQARVGTPRQQDGVRLLSPLDEGKSTDPNARSEVSRSMRSFLEREIKMSTMPQSFQKGLSFELGTKTSKSASPKPVTAQTRYGLILTSIEPNPIPFRLASLASTEDYGLVPYAPKAVLQYQIGPISNEGEGTLSAPASADANAESWLSPLPDLQFKGKIAPRGPISAGQFIPAQSLIIEQTQGFYSLELQTSKGIHRDALRHRMRAPVFGQMNLRQERDQHFRTHRNTLENVYSRGNMALNLDQFAIENRYQSSLIYRKNQTAFELNAHLPVRSPEKSSLWQQQRWEIKLQSAF